MFPSSALPHLVSAAGPACRSFESCCFDLPFCSDRLLNLPLIPWLSRFFSSFFLSFPFVPPLRAVPFLLLLLHFVFLLHLRRASSSLLSPPFCTVSLRFPSVYRRSFAGSSPARDPRRQVSNCLGSRRGAAARRETESVSSSSRVFSSPLGQLPILRESSSGSESS